MNTNLKILEFKEMSEEWLDFIIRCRHGIPHDNHIVIGAMADDQIYNYIADYIDGIITRDRFWSLVSGVYIQRGGFTFPAHTTVHCI